MGLSLRSRRANLSPASVGLFRRLGARGNEPRSSRVGYVDGPHRLPSHQNKVGARLELREYVRSFCFSGAASARRSGHASVVCDLHGAHRRLHLLHRTGGPLRVWRDHGDALGVFCSQQMRIDYWLHPDDLKRVAPGAE
jgi:hypothetical protein